jgi:hypothetical protein
MIPKEVLNTFVLTNPREQAIRTTWVNEGYEGV